MTVLMCLMLDKYLSLNLIAAKPLSAALILLGVPDITAPYSKSTCANKRSSVLSRKFDFCFGICCRIGSMYFRNFSYLLSKTSSDIALLIPAAVAASVKDQEVTEAANANVPMRARQTMVPSRHTRARSPGGVVTVRAIQRDNNA